MMRLLALLMMTTLMCTSCTALPAEERAFAVALCVEKEGSLWRVYGRIPLYQPDGGYLTVPGEGRNLTEALNNMEAAAPMRVSLSQLRLLVLDAALTDTKELAGALLTLADIQDMRLQCAVALTEMPMKAAAEALKPATGTRLSKAIDVLLKSGMEQGSILPAPLEDVIRLGTRQSAILMAMTVQDERPLLSGGYALDSDYAAAQRLSAEDTALLSLLLERTTSQQITLPAGNSRVREVAVHTRLAPGAAEVDIDLHCISGSLTGTALEEALAESCVELLSRLYAKGCDALGLGRQAVVRAEDMEAWRALDWPSQMRTLRWRVSVHAAGEI